MDLVRRLEAAQPTRAIGIALAKELVSDADSPLAIATEPGTLRTFVRLATLAGDPSPGHGALPAQA